MRKCVNVFTIPESDVEIMLMRDYDKSWEVYYRKPHYPFIYAFGLPDYEKLEMAKMIAEGCANEYMDLFT